MGAAMVRRLHEQGAQVTVFNRSPERSQALADELGVQVADTAQQAAANPVVISSLADDAAVEAIYQGPQGLISGLEPGSILVETSTVDPQTIIAMAPAVTEAGAHLLDAPVSGSVPAVLAGGLTFMVGGDASAVERATPVFEA